MPLFTELPDGPAFEIFILRDKDSLEVRRTRKCPKRRLPRDYRPEPERIGAGFYFEVRNAANNLLFRGTGSDPVGATIELPAEESLLIDDEASDFTRVDNPLDRSVFILVVPQIPDAFVVNVFSRSFARVFNKPIDEPAIRIPLA